MSLIKFNKAFPVLDRMFPEILDTDRFFNQDLFLRDNWIPAINVKEHETDFEIEVAAPGFSKKDFEVTITDDILTISAESKRESEKEEENYSRREFYYNSFKRSFTLPTTVDYSKKIRAKYENGVLLVHLEKIEVSKTEEHKKTIEID
ncbi:Hsp20/alpha crystallin family protein [Lutibacter sp. B1]|uniref:Hsp20/alpha crystallin family protein n=1 Tax=Lutibacter sp. B1 TaxID=2725996 RepID=UPI001456DE7B|nr:Hsp20/alpha crystallin family protein [Lutibacter sp. B1]NLP58359.1 Hsp20/alpha crystallin family protein [Lutibacter sp. B1]